MTLKQFASMGGKARADSLSKKRRKEIAKQAARKRWRLAATQPEK